MDFQKEGLLDGLTGAERQARIRLLKQLVEMGVSAEELRQAVADGRLPLLPVERLFSREEKYTARQLAERAGIELDFLLAIRRASGLPIDDPDAVRFNEADLESASSISSFLEMGLPESGLLDIARIFGELTARTAAATRNFVAETFIAEADVDEHQLGVRLAEAARELRPLTVKLIEYLFQQHMLEQVRNEVAISAQLESGTSPGIQETSICFVDLVGFTRLGETIPAEELGGLAGRLGALISNVVGPPVRLVKMIGDAGMLVCEDSDALIEAAFALIEAAADQHDGFPELKAGIARGRAINKWGDWFGSPVNVASRVTSIARPSSVLVTEEVHSDAAGDYRWSFAGERHLKGIQRETKLYRARRA